MAKVVQYHHHVVVNGSLRAPDSVLSDLSSITMTGKEVKILLVLPQNPAGDHHWDQMQNEGIIFALNAFPTSSHKKKKKWNGVIFKVWCKTAPGFCQIFWTWITWEWLEKTETVRQQRLPTQVKLFTNQFSCFVGLDIGAATSFFYILSRNIFCRWPGDVPSVASLCKHVFSHSEKCVSSAGRSTAVNHNFVISDELPPWRAGVRKRCEIWLLWTCVRHKNLSVARYRSCRHKCDLPIQQMHMAWMHEIIYTESMTNTFSFLLHRSSPFRPTPLRLSFTSGYIVLNLPAWLTDKPPWWICVVLNQSSSYLLTQSWLFMWQLCICF